MDSKEQEWDAVHAWETIARAALGNEIARGSRAISFSNKTLTVAVERGVFANEVHHHERALINLYKKTIPGFNLQRIRATIAGTPESM